MERSTTPNATIMNMAARFIKYAQRLGANKDAAGRFLYAGSNSATGGGNASCPSALHCLWSSRSKAANSSNVFSLVANSSSESSLCCSNSCWVDSAPCISFVTDSSGAVKDCIRASEVFEEKISFLAFAMKTSSSPCGMLAASISLRNFSAVLSFLAGVATARRWGFAQASHALCRTHPGRLGALW